MKYMFTIAVYKQTHCQPKKAICPAEVGADVI